MASSTHRLAANFRDVIIKAASLRLADASARNTTDYVDFIVGDGVPSGGYGRDSGVTLIYFRKDASSANTVLYVSHNGGTAWEAVDATLAGSDFGATGLLADVIDESTSDNGVVVDGLLIKDSGLNLPTDGVLQVEGAGTGTGDVVQRYGGSATEGLELRVYEDVISPSAIETNVVNIPANSRILSVQSNVESALTGGGTTDSYGIGTAADPDKYGSSATLTQNSKSDFLGDGTVLSSSEQLVLTGTASETADGDTALTVGSVRVRVAYWTLNSLDDA